MMSSNTSKFLLVTILAFFNPSSAIPVLDSGLINDLSNPLNVITILKEPPAALKTKNSAPECKNVNGGALLCCESTFDGGFPLVVKLSAATGYELTKDTINGIYCKKSIPGTCAKTELCCQVDAAANIPVVDDVASLALFCQHAPKA